MDMLQKPLLILISGYSGAGVSTALNILEDMGFYALDNLPVDLLQNSLQYFKENLNSLKGLAVAFRLLNPLDDEKFKSLIKKSEDSFQIHVLLLTANKQTLLNRFSSTRRKHPNFKNFGDLSLAVDDEIQRFESLEKISDIVLDTSRWSPNLLRRAIEERYQGHLPKRILYFTLASFGFKYGMFRPAEGIFDVRFIKNPYFVPELKDKMGMDQEIKNYIFSEETAQSFCDYLEKFIRFSLPLHYQEGKHFFRLGIGCTGGKHRSVAFVEELKTRLDKNPLANIQVDILHRDIDQL